MNFAPVFVDPCRGHWTSWRSTRSSTTTTFSSRRRWTNTSCSRKNRSCATSCMKPKWPKKLSWVCRVMGKSNAYIYPLVLCVDVYHTVASRAGVWYILNLQTLFFLFWFINLLFVISCQDVNLLCQMLMLRFVFVSFVQGTIKCADWVSSSVASTAPLTSPCATTVVICLNMSIMSKSVLIFFL